MSAHIDLQYFKASGKYYTEGSYRSQTPDILPNVIAMYKVVDEIKEMRRTRTLPGVTNGSDFIIYATCDKGHPVLIFPE